ncbi:tRNA dihydrouridine synthase DusB [bacterium]|jgi:tRNA-dihydrouridine synthase B|nr:tRNA dihydrouridine synthase DusB [Candidatus Parcubacteria bacterium]MBT3948701.1 tRNA dihydrouridine synthase DusB [Candidatus Parcubacteria bacterium]MBT7088383.1 tRNA dihydrouridine synthase DusB [bacterium]
MFLIKKNWITKAKKPILALAPMADMTDGPFCNIAREVSGHDFVIFREMVSAEAIVRNSEKTLKMCEFEEGERSIIQQVFGSTPDVVVEAAQIIMKKYKPDGIDINMGCPVPKIAGKAGAGAALMKDPQRAEAIVKALKKANLDVPISVKTRLGWSDDSDILEFAKMLENAGADLISIHGRTRQQGYSGEANWERIGEVKKLLKIPVLANGDMKDGGDMKCCLENTGADGVMIGRAALGNPWILKSSEFRVQSSEVLMIERIKIVLRHARLHEERYGTIVTFRKHLAYYFKGIAGVKQLRQELVKVNTIQELEKILSGIID